MTEHKPRNISVALEVFIKKDDKFLMLHRSPNKKIMPNIWMGPGGKREFNEGLYECARREVREETGLEIKNLRLLATGCGYLKDLDLEVFFDFLGADYQRGELVESEEGKLAWLTLEEILSLPNLLAELKEVLPIILADNYSGVLSYVVEYDSPTSMVLFKLEQP